MQNYRDSDAERSGMPSGTMQEPLFNARDKALIFDWSIVFGIGAFVLVLSAFVLGIAARIFFAVSGI